MTLFAVPDFRNLSLILRVFVSVSILLLLLPLLSADNQQDYYTQAVTLAAWVAPFVIITLTVLLLCMRFVLNHAYDTVMAWAITMASYLFCAILFQFPSEAWFADMILISVYVWGFMHYHAILQRALSPALSEAKLAALTARIRPHFLFNSLNAAIALVRSRPAEAEMVLENLADLFRAQLKDGNQASTLGREIELAQGYLAIETIRMGHQRLQSMWYVDAPEQAEVPHLLLQPLLENAVYHGIEPSHRPGEISISIIKRQDWIYIRIDNPLPEESNKTKKRQGNQMALANLSDRLTLMYDADATVRSSKQGDIFRVDMRLPYRKAV
ncbi:histidine kinase [Vitreoscilla massiliensis]|uniref:Histidine kinase n=1 Tax=Vitreoscilla massiliensis TaxID=1689272 RepID=A0ABY4E231_9NEIS|nr:histidine kinase [Vitreoscilla massiliensis]UOO89299.1 histidine kinase [Vitreoscilla massiliensis]